MRSRRRPTRLLAISAGVIAAVLAGPAGTALAAGGSGGHGGGGGGGHSTPPPSAYDISYPQCGSAFPTGAARGIVGVNGGIVYKANPCLGTGDGASELAWAQATSGPAFYANTADPGPAYSSYWPASGTSEDGHTCDGSNSLDCSFDYGYLAAVNSFDDAVTAEQQLGSASPASDAAALPWWLDVETGNSWQTLERAYGNTTTSQQNDTAALQGAVAALEVQGVTAVGFYSTSSQWDQITGGTGSTFAANPNWVAGFSARDASGGCSSSYSFTGGPVAMTQYSYSGFDADYVCP